MPRVTHFEFTSPDPQAEMLFFGDVFGWTFEKFADMDYWLASTGPADAIGINGAIMPEPMPGAPRVTNTIGVADIDEIIAKAVSAGATLEVGKREIPGVGWIAYLSSATGVVIGVIEPAPGSMPG